MATTILSSGVKMHRPGRARPWVLAGIGVLAAAFLFAAGGRVLTEHWAFANAERSANQTAQTHAGLLSSELQKYRLLPLVLADDPEVRAALRGDAGARSQLNAKLELLAERTDTAVIYVLDRQGTAIAASNWRLPTSFVGHDYDFRSYFTDALRAGHAEQFALGAVSHQPGLFLSQRIAAARGDGDLRGVVVVKVTFDRLEGTWRHQAGATLVTDAQGVIILTSRPDWRFTTLRPIADDALARIRHSVQFGDSPLAPLPLHQAGRARLIENDGERFVTATAAASMPGWALQHLEPLRPFEAAVATRFREALLAVALFALLAVSLAFRRYERAKMRRDNQCFLEREVARRTAELRAANDRLRVETEEHARADARLRAASAELAQANRLGIIGQITAGVAHEVNQPVAAIRTFAENAVHLFERGDSRQAITNLGTIVELTARIGRITQELRGFAQAGPGTLGPVPVRAAIDGAMLLLGDRVRESGAAIDLTGHDDGALAVLGDRVRLEQILINLLQNALDATESAPDPRIRIDVERDAGTVVVAVSDNGPGVDPSIADTLFAPLVTGRTEGLGLGLGIARKIARDFGGELDLAPATAGGATFLLLLRRVDV